MNRSLISIGMAAILLLATPPAFTIFAGAQEGPTVDDEDLEVELFEDGLVLPTTMAFVDEDTMLVLEKDNGTVRVIEDGELQEEPLLDVAVANEDERGMLGIAVSVENETTTYVFLYFTESGGGQDGDDKEGVEPAGNRLYRYELEGDQLVNPRLLLDLPALPGPRYNGGPIAIGPDDNVYVIIGDVEGHTTQVQNFEDGQAADGTSGVLRIGKNGELADPVIGTGLFGKYYFAYGIRNSFGLAFDPVTDALWDTENGPNFGDEINLIEPGFNSGWRDVQGVANQSDLDDLVLFNARSHYSDPEFSWTEPVGPTAVEFLNSSELGEEYENDMFVGDINNGAIYRFDLNENRSELVLEGELADTVADTPEESEAAVFGSDFGGVTDIKTGPDGNLYVVSLVDGAIFQILSADDSDDDELTVRSEDLDGDEITGMYTVIEDTDGDMLEEGFTPLTFDGDEGSTYVVTVADFGDREFDHWEDNGSTDRKREVTLDEDTTITARYQTEPDDDSNPAVERLVRLLDGDDCFDEDDRRRLDDAINGVVQDIFGEDGINTDRLERVIDDIVEDCNGNNGNRGQGNDNGNGQGRNGDDDDEGED